MLAISLATILVVSLTACASFSENATLWTEAAKEKQIAAAATETAQAKQTPQTPDIPPYVAKCVRYGLALAKQKQAQDKAKKAPAAKAKSPSADEMVLATVKTAEEQQKCARAVLDYYRSIQKANAAKAAKTS